VKHFQSVFLVSRYETPNLKICINKIKGFRGIFQKVRKTGGLLRVAKPVRACNALTKKRLTRFKEIEFLMDST